MGVSAAAFVGIILRSYSVMFTHQHLHQHHYLRNKATPVVAKNLPNIGFCPKVKWYQKVSVNIVYWPASTVLTHRKREINLVDDYQQGSPRFVMNNWPKS